MNKNEFIFDTPSKFTASSTLRVQHKMRGVGYANLIRQGNIAILADITIHNHQRPMFRFLPWPITGKNYRGRGLGTMLLQHVISFCKSHGIREIEGKAKGNIALLKPWYEKHGFTVETNYKIHKKISYPGNPLPLK